MKQSHFVRSRWLVLIIAGLAFTAIVRGIEKYALPSEPTALAQSDAQPAPDPKIKKHLPVSHNPYPAETISEDPIDTWRVRSNAVWSLNEAAAAGADLGILDARLSEGEDINAPDELGNTPLHLAAAAGHMQFVSALLQHGADPMALNKAGKRPAEIAASDATRLACEKGEIPRRKEIALFDAVQAGDLDTVSRALADGVNPNALSADNQHSLLTAAVLANKPAIVRALLAAHANPNYVEPSSRTALNHAASVGNVDTIRALLAAGADPLMHTNHGAYPIHDAIWSGRTEAALALIPCYESMRYNPDGKGNGYPVCMAISRNNQAVVQGFLQAGLDPNDPLFASTPLLVLAVQNNRPGIARLLLEAGADKNATDSLGKRAADYAQGDLAELLK